MPSDAETAGRTCLHVERNGPILRVSLARPDSLNALDGATLEAIAQVFSAVSTDFAVRAVVLAGRGRAFSAGADRKALPGSGRDTTTDRERRWAAQIGHRACTAIAACEVPTIARIHGWCVGGALALALSCDFRLASVSARFSVPEVDLGIPLSWGATPRLIAEIGAARAREVILLCDEFDAARAAELGVVHRAVPDDELDTMVDAWAARLAAKPEIAVHEAKSQFRAYAARSVLGDVSEFDGDLLTAALRTPTARAAFGAATDHATPAAVVSSGLLLRQAPLLRPAPQVPEAPEHEQSPRVRRP